MVDEIEKCDSIESTKKFNVLEFIKSDRYANILRTVMTFAMLLVAYFLGMNATIWTNEQIELSYQKYCAPYVINFTMLHGNNSLNTFGQVNYTFNQDENVSEIVGE